MAELWIRGGISGLQAKPRYSSKMACLSGYSQAGKSRLQTHGESITCGKNEVTLQQHVQGRHSCVGDFNTEYNSARLVW